MVRTRTTYIHILAYTGSFIIRKFNVKTTKFSILWANEIILFIALKYFSAQQAVKLEIIYNSMSWKNGSKGLQKWNKGDQIKGVH